MAYDTLLVSFYYGQKILQALKANQDHLGNDLRYQIYFILLTYDQ